MQDPKRESERALIEDVACRDDGTPLSPAGVDSYTSCEDGQTYYWA